MLADKKILVVYYTETGNTERMAELICEDARREGAQAEIIRVEECGLDDLIEADGVVVGSPTYFSNVAWQVKKLIDESIILYRRNRQLRGKVGGCFTSSGTLRDAKDCIKMLELAFGLHHKMEMVPSIVRVSGDNWDTVAEKCRNYGAEITRKIISIDRF